MYILELINLSCQGCTFLRDARRREEVKYFKPNTSKTGWDEVRVALVLDFVCHLKQLQSLSYHWTKAGLWSLQIYNRKLNSKWSHLPTSDSFSIDDIDNQQINIDCRVNNLWKCSNTPSDECSLESDSIVQEIEVQNAHNSILSLESVQSKTDAADNSLGIYRINRWCICWVSGSHRTGDCSYPWTSLLMLWLQYIGVSYSTKTSNLIEIFKIFLIFVLETETTYTIRERYEIQLENGNCSTHTFESHKT